MPVNLVISENCCNFIVLKYKELQTIIAMITEAKVTELFCMADDFCKFFDAMMEKYTLKSDKKRCYHRDSTMSKAEIMLIMILFHASGYRCLKHFYLEKVCKHLRHLFPKVVSYNRFVELEKEVAIPLALFIKKVLLGKCTGISFVDSTPLRVCRNQRIHIHKVFRGIAQRGKYRQGTKINGRFLVRFLPITAKIGIFALEIKHKLADKDSLYMEYLSVVQFAEKHGISTRTARNYCAAGKIDGAFLTGKTWNIPADAGLL